MAPPAKKKSAPEKAKKDSKNENSTKEDLSPEEKALRDKLYPYFIMRCYHIPGNNYQQDLWQYLMNNHPVFGIFFHHRHHPVRRKVRILSLIGSFCFGLAITNIIYLGFVFTDSNYEKEYVTVQYNATGTEAINNHVTSLQVTNGNIALWTIGAALHALYDNVIWSLAACTCFMDTKGGVTERIDRYRSTGVFFIVFSVIVVTALATFAATLRNAIDAGNVDTDEVDSYGVGGTQYKVFEVGNAKSYEFILAYLVELGLNYFGYYPVIGTILFTGVLGCFKYRVIGGRPAEITEMKAREDADAQNAAV